MDNGLGFANYEFPTHEQQPTSLFAHYEVPTEDLLGGPSLIDLASAEVNIGTQEGFSTFLGESIQGGGFHHQRDSRLQREESQYGQYELQQEAMKRSQAEGDVWSFEAAAAGAGVSGAVESMGAAVLRAVDPAVSDHMVQSLNADAMARTMAYDMEGMSETRKWFAGAITNTTRSLTMAALASGAAAATGGALGVAAGSTAASAMSTAAMGGTFFATTANETYANSVEELGHVKATKLAIGQGAFEGLVMTAFSAAGLGGVEKSIQSALSGGVKGLPAYLWKQGVKSFGKDFMAELTEEEMTTVMQRMHEAAIRNAGDPLIGEDGTFLSSPMLADMEETLYQTLFMVGSMKGTHSGLHFVLNPSRKNAMELDTDIGDVIVRDGETLDSKGDRVNITDRMINSYISAQGEGSQLEEDVKYWEGIAEEKKRTDNEKRVAEAVVNRLRGGEAVSLEDDQKKVLASMLNDFTKKTGKPIAPVEPIPAPAAAKDASVSLPQFILDVDPNAEVVDPLNLIVGAVEGDDDVVTGLSVVKELNENARNGRPIKFIQTSQPIDGAYSRGTVYISVPNLKRFTKGKPLDVDSLQAALTGTFAHEFTHELKKTNGAAWDELYDSLANDKKYGPMMKKSREYFDKQFALSEYMADEDGVSRDPYANMRGKEKEKERDDLYKEETLAHFMNDNFISTGLVSKMAKTNRTSLQMLKDWLRRIRNTLFRDPLYKGMVSAFNAAALNPDLGIEPISLPKETAKKKVRKRKTKKKVVKKKRASKKKVVADDAITDDTRVEAVNDDIDTLITGLTEGYSDGEVDIEKTDIVDFFVALEEAKQEDAGGPYVTAEQVAGLDVDNLVSKGLVSAEDAKDIPHGKGRLRPTGWGIRVMGKSDVGERFSVDPDPVSSSGGSAEAVRIGLINAGVERREDLDGQSKDVRQGYVADLWMYRRDNIDNSALEKSLLEEMLSLDEVSVEERSVPTVDGRIDVKHVVFDYEGDSGRDKAPIGALHPDPESRWRFSTSVPEELTEDDVERMEWASTSATVGLFGSEYEGRENDLIDEVWRGSEAGVISTWMRKNKKSQFRSVVEAVWPKTYDKLDGGVKKLRKRMLEGVDSERLALRSEARQEQGVSLEDSLLPMTLELNAAQAVVPSPVEYRQLQESDARFSFSLNEMNLPDQAYDPDRSHMFIDKRTRDAYSAVMAYGEIRVGKEVISQIETEAHGQTEFNMDREGTVAHLIQKGKDGDVFNAKDWVKAREAHAWILSKLDNKEASGMSPEEIEDNIKTKLLLAQYSNEAASEWGRSGAMMKDRVETARERGLRGVDRALTSMPRKIQQKIARQKALALTPGMGEGSRKRIAELRDEWHEAVQRVEEKLREDGWDLDHIDKYLGSPAAVDELVTKIRRAKGEIGTFEAILYEIFINNILSGPLTWSANTISNVAMGAYEHGPKRIAAALLNEVALGVGLPTGERGGPRIGELPYLYLGAFKGFKRGIVHFFNTLVTEEESFERSLGIKGGRTRMDQQYQKNIPGAVGYVQRFFGTTMMTALDSFQKSMNGTAEVMALAYRQAKIDGKVDAEVGKFVSEVMENRNHPLWHVALEKARDMVFQGEPSSLAKAALRARTSHWAIKWVMPFITTPDNIYRKGVGYSPLGLLSLTRDGYARSIFRGLKTGDWSGINEKAAQLMMTVALVTMLMDDDEDRPLITGTNPDQPQDWAAEDRSRTIQPMSVRVGDHYVSFARIEPIGTWLALSKDLTVALKQWGKTGTTGVLNSGSKVLDSLLNMTNDKTFLKSANDVLMIAKDPERGARRLARGIFTGTVPLVGSKIWQQSQKANRKYKYNRRSVTEGDERWYMYGRNMVRSLETGLYKEHIKYDQYGKPVPDGANPTNGMVSDFWYKLLVPLRAKHVHEGVADKVVRRYNAQHPEERPIGIKEVEMSWDEPTGEKRHLSEEQLAEYGELTGMIFKALADSEAVDLKNPSRDYVKSLWNGNWADAQRQARDILRMKWDNVPVEANITAIRDEVYARKMRKHVNVLGKKNPSRKDLPVPVRNMSPEEQKIRLDREKKNDLEQKKVSAKFLLDQGYGVEGLRQRIPSTISRGTRIRAKRFMAEFEKGHTGERPEGWERKVPRRIAGAR